MPSASIEQLEQTVERLNRQVGELERDIEGIRASGVEFQPGKIVAGDRKVRIEKRGITFISALLSPAVSGSLRWLKDLTDPDTRTGYLYNFYGGSGSDWWGYVALRAEPVSGTATANPGWVTLHSIDHDDSGDDYTAGLYQMVGATGTFTFKLKDDTTVGTVTLRGGGAMLYVDQPSTTGAMATLLLDQADIDEDYIKIVGTSDTNVDRALVDAADFTTPGAIKGWLKINVNDTQATNPITDGDYYIPFYAAPSA